MAAIHELNVYYTKLEKAFDSGGSSLEYNEDRSHNSMVMKLMFDKASTVNMFCGELSILREGFRNHVEGEIQGGEKIVDGMLDSLNTFLSKEASSLNIVFENYKREYLDDLVRKSEFLKFLQEGKIKMYKLRDSFTLKKDLVHFAYTDNQIARIEQDKSKHNAICMFGRQDTFDLLDGNFTKLLGVALPITSVES